MPATNLDIELEYDPTKFEQKIIDNHVDRTYYMWGLVEKNDDQLLYLQSVDPDANLRLMQKGLLDKHRILTGALYRTLKVIPIEKRKHLLKHGIIFDG